MKFRKWIKHNAESIVNEYLTSCDVPIDRIYAGGSVCDLILSMYHGKDYEIHDVDEYIVEDERKTNTDDHSYTAQMYVVNNVYTTEYTLRPTHQKIYIYQLSTHANFWAYTQFDINLCRVAIINGKLEYTEEFIDGVEKGQVKICNFHNFAYSIMRADKKAKKYGFFHETKKAMHLLMEITQENAELMTTDGINNAIVDFVALKEINYRLRKNDIQEWYNYFTKENTYQKLSIFDGFVFKTTIFHTASPLCVYTKEDIYDWLYEPGKYYKLKATIAQHLHQTITTWIRKYNIRISKNKVSTLLEINECIEEHPPISHIFAFIQTWNALRGIYHDLKSLQTRFGMTVWALIGRKEIQLLSEGRQNEAEILIEKKRVIACQSVTEEIAVPDTDNFTFQHLTATLELQEAGDKLHNCLGGYTHQLYHGDVAIFLINEKETGILSALELRYMHSEWKVIQHRSYNNGIVPSTFKAAEKHITQFFKKKKELKIIHSNPNMKPADQYIEIQQEIMNDEEREEVIQNIDLTDYDAMRRQLDQDFENMANGEDIPF